MLGPSWIPLFQRIPAKLHNSISLTMVTGTEIVVQAIFRVESNFLILRGRMAGTTDAARLVIVPFDQITNLNFTKQMTEPEVRAIFGKLLEPAEAQNGALPESGENQESAAANALIATAAEEPNAEEVQKETPTLGVAVPMTTTLWPNPSPPPAAPEKDKPSKSILLARLRARLAEQAGKR